jgi:sec-independent protein translocase protein TatA
MDPTVSALALHIPSITQDLVILVVALLIFGKRLPEVARMLGKSIVEFKKGIADIGNEADRAAAAEPPRAVAPPAQSVEVKQIPSAPVPAPAAPAPAAAAAAAPAAAEAKPGA